MKKLIVILTLLFSVTAWAQSDEDLEARTITPGSNPPCKCESDKVNFPLTQDRNGAVEAANLVFGDVKIPTKTAPDKTKTTY